jgi:hypothetical protein
VQNHLARSPSIKRGETKASMQTLFLSRAVKPERKDRNRCPTRLTGKLHYSAYVLQAHSTYMQEREMDHPFQSGETREEGPKSLSHTVDWKVVHTPSLYLLLGNRGVSPSSGGGRGWGFGGGSGSTKHTRSYDNCFTMPMEHRRSGEGSGASDWHVESG